MLYNSLNPKRIGAIISAYTGLMCGDFAEYHKYIEELVGHKVDKSEVGDLNLMVKVKALSADDFKAVHRWCGGK